MRNFTPASHGARDGSWRPRLCAPFTRTPLRRVCASRSPPPGAPPAAPRRGLRTGPALPPPLGRGLPLLLRPLPSLTALPGSRTPRPCAPPAALVTTRAAPGPVAHWGLSSSPSRRPAAGGGLLLFTSRFPTPAVSSVSSLPVTGTLRHNHERKHRHLKVGPRQRAIPPAVPQHEKLLLCRP
jgi:hypothetical protein